jgi:hypothetical protein
MSEERRDKSRTQEKLAASERRDIELRKERDKEQAAAAAKINKLRALRLAKEEEDRRVAEAAALANPPKAKSKKSKKTS